MLPWLSSEFFVRLAWKVNKKPTVEGIKLKDESGRGWEIGHVLMMESRDHLQYFASECGR